MRYNGTLPEHIDGHWCNTLVQQFQAWKGSEYVPENVHPAIQWSNSDPFIVKESEDTKCHMCKQNSHGNKGSEQSKPSAVYTTAKGSIPLYVASDVENNKKCKSESTEAIVFFNNNKNRKHISWCKKM